MTRAELKSVLELDVGGWDALVGSAGWECWKERANGGRETSAAVAVERETIAVETVDCRADTLPAARGGRLIILIGVEFLRRILAVIA